MIDSVPLAWRLKKQKYNLVGTKCLTCSQTFFPPKSFCPECRRKGQLTDFQFSGDGRIESFTIIRTAPKGFESQTPYAVGIIALDEGAKVIGQIVGDVEIVDCGKKVKKVFRRISEDGKEGVISYGVKFELTE